MTPTLTTTNIMAFGNSLTFGAISATQLHLQTRVPYPSTLLTLLTARYPQQAITVANEGVPGEYVTDPDTRIRFNDRLTSLGPDLVLIWEGVNDLNAGVSPVMVSWALEDLIMDSQKNGAEVLIARLTPATGTNAAAKQIVPLNDRIDAIASKHGIAPAVDLYGAIMADLGLYLRSDGLHLTPEGYQRVGQEFFSAITSRFEKRPAIPTTVSALTQP